MRGLAATIELFDGGGLLGRQLLLLYGVMFFYAMARGCA
jgi:hypothetical protein